MNVFRGSADSRSHHEFQRNERHFARYRHEIQTTRPATDDGNDPRAAFCLALSRNRRGLSPWRERLSHTEASPVSDRVSGEDVGVGGASTLRDREWSRLCPRLCQRDVTQGLHGDLAGLRAPLFSLCSEAVRRATVKKMNIMST